MQNWVISDTLKRVNPIGRNCHFGIIAVFTSEFGFAPNYTPAAAPAAATPRVDSVVFREQATQAAGISMLQTGEIDIYAFPIANAELFRRITGDKTLGYERSFGSYDEITFNPVGPTFPGTGKLNPFSVPRIREASKGPSGQSRRTWMKPPPLVMTLPEIRYPGPLGVFTIPGRPGRI